MDGQDIILPSHANPIVLEWIRDGKVKIVESGCWEWARSTDKDGYGQIPFHGTMMKPHRLSINARSGFISMHSCDNPPCCNPWHLKEATHHENALDKKYKNRGRRIGIRDRCKCGLAVDKHATDCASCRSIRLNKPPCFCGEISITKGMCNRHYSQSLRHRKP